MKQLQKPGKALFLNEVEMSAYADYREFLRQVNAEWNEKHIPGFTPQALEERRIP